MEGQVQGVGFRPFVWRLAKEEDLAGLVGNVSAGVRIEIQGAPPRIEAFRQRLQTELPPLARITRMEAKKLAPVAAQREFVIEGSGKGGGAKILVSPDVGVCEDCLADIADPANPRYGYAFTNCTNCGPRFSITSSLPYDRATTTMACFPLCQNCATEYANPADRRFHAQPVACAACGPELWLVDNPATGPTHSTPENRKDALIKAARLIVSGKILAIRGLGGFQLACDAKNAEAVELLRLRKNRPHKALAIMAADLDSIREICETDEYSEELLASFRKPIVLCPAREANEFAPDTDSIGVMLPSTPLHALLFEELKSLGVKQPLLVMTSANPPGEPICLGNREALKRLGHLADAWLLHNRDILCRVDDSVVRAGENPVIFRRARGYVPESIPLNISGPSVLGCGAELKATFCLTRGDRAFPGQHIGDLQSPAALDFYEQSLAHMQRLLEVAPELIVHDLHPDFSSTRFARNTAELTGVPVVGLQHHVAHGMACLGENNFWDPALALCLDGSGLGTDGAIWGGELLWIDPGRCQWERAGQLSTFPLPGGEMAIREPWRVAAALRHLAGLSPRNREEEIIWQMLIRGINSPATSSCGRLFDAVAAELGVCRAVTHEGQAAMRLEKLAKEWREGLKIGGEEFLGADGKVNSVEIFRAILAMKESGMEPALVAHRFHAMLAGALGRLVEVAGARHGLETIALSGGVMQNGLLLHYLQKRLYELGMKVLLHRQLPPGDGGISFGQAVWGLALARAGKVNGGYGIQGSKE